MTILNHIQNIRDGIQEGRYTTEAAVSQGIVLPTLQLLGWPVFDIAIVIPEFSIEGRRVDYALCHPANKPHVFIEVKKVGLTAGADRQLFEYAFHLGVPMAILTEGQEWSFYLPGEQGRYDERRVYKIDLLERDISEAAGRLKRYAGYDNICSGEALKSARSDYQDIAKERIFETHIPKAWEALLNDQDSLLLEMLAEKVEDLCGYKPDLDLCGQYLSRQAGNNPYETSPPGKKGITTRTKRSFNTLNKSSNGKFTLVFKGENIQVGSAVELMTKFFQLMFKEDKSLFDRFISRKHGRKRRYLAKEKKDLYPGRPDLAEQFSVEVVPGFWLGTNYSRKNIQDIINLALEVAGPQLRDMIQTQVIQIQNRNLRNAELQTDRKQMNHSVHNKIVSFIWSIADDCLRDIYVRGKYRDVILPMVVLRRLDTLLEPSKDKVLEEVAFQKNDMGLTELDDKGLEDAAGYVFYNTSKWTLKKLFTTATNNQQILLANVEDYLAGFSANVKEIIEKFNLIAQVRHMAAKDVLLDVLEKFTSPYLNLTPNDLEDPDGNIMPALTNLGMGYVFEELIRKFNEENNEEAGEHFTPREVIELMTRLVFEPVKEKLPVVMTIYDPACGSGGMLTESQNFIKDEKGSIQAKGDVYLYGKEINDETYAICKSDMMIKGNDPAHIRPGSTLSTDEFAGNRFDFMLSNPPYGKSWGSEQKFIKDGAAVIDPRFKVKLKDYWGQPLTVDAAPRSSDGQLLFLMEMVSKMKDEGPSGSRIASVHNGSSLFTGDAGSGESNIRRHIIENDLLEAIIQLPNNLFYNTGITTYIWLLSNKKQDGRKDKVQLIDASRCFQKLRKNLGNKNCEFSKDHIQDIVATCQGLKTMAPVTDEEGNDTGIASQLFDNRDFGYYKVAIERPDRRSARFTADSIAPLRFDKALLDPMQWIYAQFADTVYTPGTLADNEKEILAFCEDTGFTLNARNRKKLFSLDTWQKHKKLIEAAQSLMDFIGSDTFDDFNLFHSLVDKTLKDQKIKLSATEKKAILNAVSWYDEKACRVIKKKVKLTQGKSGKLDRLLQHLGCEEADLPDFGYYPVDQTSGKKGEYLTFEPCSDLRDHESVPLKGNIHDYFKTEVAPHVPEAWINLDSVKIGYEISFNKYFYRHKPLRSMEEVAKDILDLEHQAEGLIADILGVDVAVVSGVGHD